MRKSRKDRDIFIKRESSIKNFDFRTSDLSLIRNAWENLPRDVTTEERMMFMEVTEKVLRVNSMIGNIYFDKKKNSKN